MLLCSEGSKEWNPEVSVWVFTIRKYIHCKYDFAGTNGDVIVFTFVAFFHVRTQPHIVRTGTRVLGGMGRDLRCRKTQVVTASIWLGAELTGIWSCSRMEEKRSYFSNNLFPALGKEISDPLKRPSPTPYFNLSGCLSIFTVCMVEWNLTKYYKNLPNT